MAQKTASILSPSLPQKDNPFERAEREVQLLGSRKIYEYSNATGLPMPMAAAQGAIAQLPELVGWIEGQGINQAKIFVDLGIWKVETSGSPLVSPEIRKPQVTRELGSSYFSAIRRGV